MRCKQAGFICAALSLTTMSVQAEPAAATTRSFRWLYDQKWYALTYTFPDSIYSFYKRVPRTYKNYADYVIESSSHRFIGNFATKLKALGTQNGLNEWQTANLIVKFVQYIPYRVDVGEYPRFPIETLIDFKGDCEDSAILLAAILSYLGYDVLLVSPPGHMAVAVACSNCEGTYYTQDGQRYFYIETTDESWPIGRIPDQYANKDAKIYAVTNTTDSGSMLASKTEAPAADKSDEDISYSALITVNGVTYRVRIVRHADGTWSYE